MNRPRLAVAAGRWSALAVVLLAALLGGCGQAAPQPTSPEAPGPSGASPPATASPEPVVSTGELGEIPAGARVSDGGPDPRTPAYWVAWSTCGENSQAALAEANGGREAGWVLLDDLIVEPGLALGDYAIRSCRQGVAVLEARPRDPAYALATQVLAAQANLSVGAESCRAAEGALAVANALLSSLAFDGAGRYLTARSQGASVVKEATTVLTSYNAGTLCL